MKMDWSEKNLCIKCNEGGNLLVCSENGCPLSIHERCMGCPASFDDAGQFYCPYCLYKQAVAEARQAREYALSRKKALLIFMDEEKKGGKEERNLEENKRDGDNGQNQPKDSAANATTTTCEKVGVAEEENIEEEESEPSECSENEKPSELKNSNEEEKQIEHEDGENSAGCGGEDENKVCNKEEEKNGQEVFETSSASTGEDSPRPKSFKRKKVMEKVRKNDKSKQTSSSVNKRATRPSPSRSKVKIKNETFGTGKRKRLYWREDDEERNLEENKRDGDNGQNQPIGSAANAHTTTCEKVSVAEEENIEKEESEPSECSENEEPSELKNSNEKEKKIEHEEGENSEDCDGEDENEICNEEEEKNGEEVFETSSASTGRDSPRPKSSKRKKVMEKVRKNDKRKQTSPSVNKRASRPSPSRSIVKIENETFGTGKRKRLYWREDEEEMLKSGVEKFEKEANKNLPWRKILEFGQHVFDGTRTPGDLRDKWRNMLAK